MKPQCYIETGDNDEFERHITITLNQIDVFETEMNDLNIEEAAHESEDEGSENGEKLNMTDINAIFEKVKTSTTELGVFDLLLTIMQNFLIIPNDEGGKETWGKISDVILKLSGSAIGSGIDQQVRRSKFTVAFIFSRWGTNVSSRDEEDDELA